MAERPKHFNMWSDAVPSKMHQLIDKNGKELTSKTDALRHQVKQDTRSWTQTGEDIGKKMLQNKEFTKLKIPKE